MPDLQTLLSEAYQREVWLELLANKFSLDRFIKPIVSENEAVEKFEQLGIVTTKDGKKLPVFELHIKPKTQLQRNRAQLRHLVAKKIRTETGALAVYVDDQEKQWRFSFIKIEYKITESGELTTEQTASRRFTYLLGKGTKTRTATEQFNRLNQKSRLADLEAAFAVESLNKEFYTKIYEWYERARQKVVFPNDEKHDAETHIATSLIRLLTRLLFVWFIKEKQLINPDLFDRSKLETLIDWEKDSSFYKAILQNLFFATLNREIEKREFRTTTNDKANRKNYLASNVYRYQKYFKDTQEIIIALFRKTPFLNGGLFECLDREASEEEKQTFEQDKSLRRERIAIRIDGFSDRPDNSLSVPNALFFDEDESGLIDLLSQYQFTVEESTPLDVDVALDPELLGKVFENLLATYNPETQQVARQATGSYYTPREIVSYMVDESLKAYLREALTQPKKTEANLKTLFAGTNEFDAQQTETLIEAIDRIKILDPAVGSGAFPMGVLQRLVALLSVLDPGNQKWKQQQLDRLPDWQSIQADLQTAGKINDTEASKKAREELQKKEKEIEEAFAKEADYSRKLYLIENAIYGVDIQPIAIQIAKLRFFISLVIEQQPNEEKNYGIRALPNLETKFVAADSLLALGEMPREDNYFDREIRSLRTDLQKVRKKHFAAETLETKRKYRDEDQAIRKQIVGSLMRDEVDTEIVNNIKKAAAWDPYDQNTSSAWFDPEWMFGITDGFDLVLANPPYVQIQKFSGQSIQKDWASQNYQTFTKSGDIYCLFYEKGHRLLNQKGHLCYITSNKWMRAKYGEKLRKYFLENVPIHQLIDFGDSPIFEATTYTNILLFSKKHSKQASHIWDLSQTYQANVSLNKMLSETPLGTRVFSENSFVIVPKKLAFLKKKIESIGTPLKDWDISIYRGVLTGFNEAFIIDNATKEALVAEDPKSAEILKPILRGRDIKRYQAKWAGFWLIDTHNGYGDVSPIKIGHYEAVKRHLDKFYPQLEKRQDQGVTPYNLRQCAYHADFEKEKIVYAEIVSDSAFFFDNKKYYPEATTFILTGENIKFLTALLNSKLLTYSFKNFYAGGDLRGNTFRYKKIFLEQLPIPQIPEAAQQPFIQRVDQILSLKAQDPDADTVPLEAEIDRLVYQLYDLSDEEIKLIEGK